MSQTPIRKPPSPFRRRQRRKLFLLLVLPAFGVAAALAVTAINKTQVYFYAPTKLAATDHAELADREIRVGGMVLAGSLKQGEDTAVEFIVTDGVTSVPVFYDDALPGLVAEGEGVVAQGRLREDGVFLANNVLAKHDENYMAPEVADALKDSGMYETFKQTGSAE